MFSLFILLSAVICVSYSADAFGCSTFTCEYNVMLKLIQLEEKSAKQDIEIADLKGKLEDAKNIITKLKGITSSDGTTYIRWGRTRCPNTADLVYDGYVAGSLYKHSGTGSNSLCLPKDPIYSNHTDGFQTAGRIFGAEYETNSYPNWKYFHDHEVPCAVCGIPRTNVIMVPGKNRCHNNNKLEYKGFLMAGHYSHASSSQFICVDENPETIAGTHQDLNGRLFYFVEGECGSLRCDPYKNGWELTCAVCSYSLA